MRVASAPVTDSRARRRSSSDRRTSKPARPPRGGPGQVGRRPSNPAFLALLGLVWIACGAVALLELHASWKLIPGIVFIGIGLFFLRGAATTVERHTRD